MSEQIRRAISELGFEQPMPVQEQVIPYLLGSHIPSPSTEGEGSNELEASPSENGLEGASDLIALAQTGTGKTAAFGIPLLQTLDTDNRQTQALILSPTRELCLQISDDLKDFAKYLPGVHIVPVYGGTSIVQQMRSLERGAQIIVDARPSHRPCQSQKGRFEQRA